LYPYSDLNRDAEASSFKPDVSTNFTIWAFEVIKNRTLECLKTFTSRLILGERRDLNPQSLEPQSRALPIQLQSPC
jgi:hypothetical protein